MVQFRAASRVWGGSSFPSGIRSSINSGVGLGPGIWCRIMILRARARLSPTLAEQLGLVIRGSCGLRLGQPGIRSGA